MTTDDRSRPWRSLAFERAQMEHAVPIFAKEIMTTLTKEAIAADIRRIVGELNERLGDANKTGLRVSIYQPDCMLKPSGKIVSCYSSPVTIRLTEEIEY